ncbi:type IV secretion protein Rhs [Burkholderia sp. SRS-46]|nr:type IV secretion protein Rhs [Burkholderia sp. SRS-46]
MGLPAVRHLDPVVGVDVHSVLVAPSPTPVFLPHPHVGFMLDLREYVEAAKGVVGSIAMAIVQEKVTEYLDDHPDVVKQLDDAAGLAAGKLADLNDDPIVAEGLRLQRAAAAFKGGIDDALGANVGSGGSAGRPIFVNGLLRATAGTHSFHVPGLHFPLGESFAPPPPEDPLPSDDAESYMGSRTVLANNDPMSFMALPAMSCWSVGLEPPSHNGAHTARSYPSMPSSVMLPIPAGRPVLVGGPPVMNMAAAAKGLFKAFQGSKWARALADKLHLKPGFLRCKVLKAEPVDVTTGEVIVRQNDFKVSGRLSLVWDRCYASHDPHAGAVGAGWQTPADIRLELMRHDGGIGAAAHFPDHAAAFDSAPRQDGWAFRAYDGKYGHALYRRDGRFVLRMRSGIEYAFDRPAGPPRASESLDDFVGPALPIARIADLNGNAWSFEREPDGRLVRLVEWKRDASTGRVIECGGARGRDAARLTSLTLIDAGGHAHPLVSYEHDGEGNLTAAIDAMAHPHRFAYADGHRMVSHASARGVSFHYSYRLGDDGRWRVDHAWGDEGLFDYRFAYDRARMETCVTDSLGHVSVVQMNERGLPVIEIDPLGGVTAYRYDAQGRTKAEIDPAGRTTGWEYDAYGNLIVHTLPDGAVMRSEYDGEHRLVRVTVPGERTWRYEWDEAGNLLAQTTPSQAMFRYRYDAHGQLVAYTGPRDTVAQFEYDRDGHLAMLVDERGHRTRYTHDTRGNVLRVVNALGQASSYEYDRNGNLTRAVETGGGEIRCDYDTDGNLVRYRDPMGYVSRMTYSPLGQISKRLMPDGNVVEYRYDTEERLVGVLDERGALYALKRDALGRIVEEVDYWGQSRRYDYDPSGLLLRSVDPLGRAIDYRNDLLGRIVQKRVPDPRQPDGTRIETFVYDRSGNLVRAENPDCVVELRYDAEGRVVEERQGGDFVIACAYDAAGNRIERRTERFAHGRTMTHAVRYRYDELNAVTAIEIDDAAPVTLERDAIGQVRLERLGAHQRRESTYGADGLLAKQTLLSGAGVLFASEYAYDANGELIEKRDSRLGVDRFEYDPVGRVTRHIDPAGKLHRFLYDPAGDLLKTHVRQGMGAGPFRVDQPGGAWAREGEIDGRRYTFDRAGNLVRKRDERGDLRLSWDADGLLIESDAERRTAEGVVRTHTRYAYDAFHRRVGKRSRARLNEAAHAGGVSNVPMMSRDSTYFWDGDAVAKACVVTEGELARRSGAGGAQGCLDREWIYYPGTFQPLAVVHCAPAAGEATGSGGVASFERSDDEYDATASGGLYFFHGDPNGSPGRVTDVLGRIVWEQRYTAWGVPGEAESPQAFDQPLRFQGQYFDEESGLHYNRHRYYDPDSGAFISQDPIGLAGGVNVYQYAPNPLEWVDPLGLAKKPPSTSALRDGTGASAADMAASVVGGGSRSGQDTARKRLLAAVTGGVYTCWRCGQTSTNPDDMHLGHKNVPTSKGGNLDAVNIALEGASCNLSAGSSGYVKAGMSCVERGSCGAPYGR